MQAKYRKGIWVFLAVQLLTAHLWMGYQMVQGEIYLGPFYRLYRFLSLIFPIWILGSCIAGVLQLGVYLRFRRAALRCMEPVEESWIRNVSERAEEEAGVKRAIPLYRSTAVHTPMILGFHSQVLLIPGSDYEWPQLYMIFLHEWTHVKKKDIWYKLTFTVFTCLLWFQPLMYFLRSAAFRDTEAACDQQVMRGKAETERSAYAGVLLESLRQRQERELLHSACFTNSKAVMRARISVVMDEGGRFWLWGALLLLLMAVETAAFLLTFGLHSYRDFQERTAPEPTVNIYEGYEAPASFTEQVVEEMTALTPQDEETYRQQWMNRDFEERLPFAEIKEETEGPWQVQIQESEDAREAAAALLFRYQMYFENQERGSAYRQEEGGFTGLELLNYRRLAGDSEDYLFAVIFREYMGTSLAGTENWQYHNWTLHIKKVSDHVCELVGIAETKEVLAAFLEKGAKADIYDFPELDIKEKGSCRARTGEEHAEVTWNDGVTWAEVPVSLEKLFARGDQMDGTLHKIQDKSYVVTKEMTAFAYGGDAQTPVTVTCSPDEGVTWNTSVLTYDYRSVRRLFLSFPDAEHGFLVLTSDRTMWQEASILFRTEDGGASWQEVGTAGPDPAMGHSLTTGAVFVTPEVGFLTIRDSQEPELWRTADGGETWERIENLEKKEYYSMAYPPEYDRDTGILKLYVGMEEYSELGGTKCRYHSENLGATWTYDGLFVRE